MLDAVHAAAAGRPVKLGRKPAQHKAKNLQLRRYLTSRTLAAAPSSVHYGQKVAKVGGTFPMYANDRLGDCTCAAAGHHIEVWTANAQTLRVPSETDVERTYIPGTGNADDGRYLNDVLDYWRKTGIGSDRIEAYAEVDVKNLDEVKAALWIFGGLYLGVGLPVTAQQQRTWSYVASAPASDREPYSWGGHCVNATGYTRTSGMYLVTWGTLIRMTWGFFKRYVDEAFAIVTKDWIETSGVSPTGLRLDELLADASSI
jgi:hypothetical protein